jgi:hypothetical protein
VTDCLATLESTHLLAATGPALLVLGTDLDAGPLVILDPDSE